MKNSQIFKFLLLITVGIIAISCNQSDKLQQQPLESINSGKLTVYCDESIFPVMDSIFKMYQKTYPKVELTAERVDARRAMYLLLSGNARTIVSARSYLKDEDSLMKVFNVQPHQKMEIAQDALVFYASQDFPLDTLNEVQIKRILTERETTFRTFFPTLKEEPKFFINNHLSSEYSNLSKLVVKDQPIVKKLNFINGCDSVKQIVLNTPFSIGIGYLSHVIHNPNYKAIKIGYMKADGRREPPQIVHQAFIVQKRYPYIVSYWAYLQEDRKNLPFYFASFISRESQAQVYLKDAGIVPAYARFKLIKD